MVGRLSRNEFEAILDAMVRAGLTEIEEAEFEKAGELIRFRKVRLTAAGMDLRAGTRLELLISDGMVEEFARRGPAPGRKKKTKDFIVRKANNLKRTFNKSNNSDHGPLEESEANYV